MALWSQFIRHIYGELPDCPDFALERALITAANEVLRTARTYRAEGLTAGPLVANDDIYPVATLPANTELCGVVKAWLGTEELLEGNTLDVGAWAPGATERLPRIMAHSATEIRLAPMPYQAGGTITLIGALQLPPTATGLPDALWDTHHEAIERLAVAALRRSSGKPWSNPVAAQQAQYEGDRLMLRLSSLHGAPRSNPLRVRPA